MCSSYSYVCMHYMVMSCLHLQIKLRSTHQLEKEFQSSLQKIILIGSIHVIKEFILSKSRGYIFCRKEQDDILFSQKKEEIIAIISTKWYSLTLRKEFSEFLFSKFKYTWSFDEIVRMYFEADGRILFDKGAMLIVCDSYYTNFTDTQFEELYTTAKVATEKMRKEKDIRPTSIGHYNITATAMDIGLYYEYEEPMQESSVVPKSILNEHIFQDHGLDEMNQSDIKPFSSQSSPTLLHVGRIDLCS